MKDKTKPFLREFKERGLCDECGYIISENSHYCSNCETRVPVAVPLDFVNQSILYTLEKLKKNADCRVGYPHICSKHPEDCDKYLPLSFVLDEFGVEKE